MLLIVNPIHSWHCSESKIGKWPFYLLFYYFPYIFHEIFSLRKVVFLRNIQAKSRNYFYYYITITNFPSKNLFIPQSSAQCLKKKQYVVILMQLSKKKKKKWGITLNLRIMIRIWNSIRKIKYKIHFILHFVLVNMTKQKYNIRFNVTCKNDRTIKK